MWNITRNIDLNVSWWLDIARWVSIEGTSELMAMDIPMPVCTRASFKTTKRPVDAMKCIWDPDWHIVAEYTFKHSILKHLRTPHNHTQTSVIGARISEYIWPNKGHIRVPLHVPPNKSYNTTYLICVYKHTYGFCLNMTICNDDLRWKYGVIGCTNTMHCTTPNQEQTHLFVLRCLCGTMQDNDLMWKHRVIGCVRTLHCTTPSH